MKEWYAYYPPTCECGELERLDTPETRHISETHYVEEYEDCVMRTIERRRCTGEMISTVRIREPKKPKKE